MELNTLVKYNADVIILSSKNNLFIPIDGSLSVEQQSLIPPQHALEEANPN